jgi:hypothetical protein
VVGFGGLSTEIRYGLLGGVPGALEVQLVMFVVETVACAAAGASPSAAMAVTAAIQSLGKSRVPSALLTPSACAATPWAPGTGPLPGGEEEVIGHIDTERRFL